MSPLVSMLGLASTELAASRWSVVAFAVVLTADVRSEGQTPSPGLSRRLPLKLAGSFMQLPPSVSARLMSRHLGRHPRIR